MLQSWIFCKIPYIYKGVWIFISFFFRIFSWPRILQFRVHLRLQNNSRVWQYPWSQLHKKDNHDCLMQGCRNWGGGGTCPLPPRFGQISWARGSHYAHHITTWTPGFSDLPKALICTCSFSCRDAQLVKTFDDYDWRLCLLGEIVYW